jgi:hypothetical protein
LIDGEAYVEDAGFEGHDAVVAAAGFGHAIDVEVFVGVLGMVFIADFVDKVGEGFGIFAVEHAGFGGESVQEAVAAGSGFAFRGAGARGFLRVYAICVYLRLRGHSFLFNSTLSGGYGVLLIGMAGSCWKYGLNFILSARDPPRRA